MPDRGIEPELLRVLRAQRLSRRGFLRGVGLGGAALGLAACGTKGANTSGGVAQASAAPDFSATEKVVNWSNWPLYIDVDNKTKRHPTLDAFTKQTGIKVKYVEDINDNNEFFGKIRPQLAAGQDTGRDLIVLTDWMAGRLVRLGWVQSYDKAKVPNAKNLLPTLQHPGFDKDRTYSLPWQSGLTGIAYNPKATGGKEVRSITQLLTDPSLKGKVTALTEMRDTMGLVLLEMGKDPMNFTDADFSAGIDMLKKAVAAKQIRQFTGNNYAQDLAAGNIAAAIAWSGDVIQLQADNPKIKFVAPDAGLMIWSDNMLIPIKARHKANAEKIMNYYYEPQVAAEVAAYVNYICPVVGAKEAIMKIDASLAKNPLIFPDDATLSKAHSFKSLDAATEQRYTNQFQAVTGA